MPILQILSIYKNIQLFHSLNVSFGKDNYTRLMFARDKGKGK